MNYTRVTIQILAVTALLTTAAFGWQILGVSERDEIRAGRQAADQVERQVPIRRDGPWPDYIEELGRRLARVSERPHLPYRFRIINRREVNAFALPGGFIYFYRGILDLARSEAEVAGVVAHEIVHASAGHHASQSQKVSGLNAGLGALSVLFGRRRSGLEQLSLFGAQLGGAGLAARFSRGAEREADTEAVTMMRTVGLDPNGMISMFERMDRLNRSDPGALEGFFATHPSLEDRQENIEQLLLSTDGRLARNSAEFERLP